MAGEFLRPVGARGRIREGCLQSRNAALRAQASAVHVGMDKSRSDRQKLTIQGCVVTYSSGGEPGSKILPRHAERRGTPPNPGAEIAPLRPAWGCSPPKRVNSLSPSPSRGARRTGKDNDREKLALSRRCRATHAPWNDNWSLNRLIWPSGTTGSELSENFLHGATRLLLTSFDDCLMSNVKGIGVPSLIEHLY